VGTGTARRLWALDGARLTQERSDMLDGAAPGPVRLIVPTFLVEHDDGLVLMDTGLAPDAAQGDAAVVYGEVGEQVEFTPSQRVDAQLAALGFAADDVTHVVVSHVHFDHTGGLRLFRHARFLLGAGDRDAVLDPASSEIARPEDLTPVRDADWTFVEGDLDLFGDGAVTMLVMPGHTPGNTSLLVHLPARSLVLTGDTAHLRGALTTRAPMSADTDRAQAGASLDRLVALAEEHDAELWVTHDPDDWERYGAPGEITASDTACGSRGRPRR
jgi:N-acyl homoserine lactone hydrolase